MYSKAFERKGGINLGFNFQKGLNSYVKFSSKQLYYKKSYTYNSNTINPGVWSGLIYGEGFSYRERVAGTLICEYSTSSTPTINPWFITGFVDGQGSFMVQIVKKGLLGGKT